VKWPEGHPLSSLTRKGEINLAGDQEFLAPGAVRPGGGGPYCFREENSEKNGKRRGQNFT